MNYNQTIAITFPPTQSGEPVISQLVKKFDLTINILKANINPGREGLLVIELSGDKSAFDQGILYLLQHDLLVKYIAQEIHKNDEICLQCGLCTSLCPTKALFVEHETRIVNFDTKKCIACGNCISICPVGAIETNRDLLA